ncbi:unnamed protein product [Rotaria socialis]
MFPPGAFNQANIAFPFPGQQLPGSLYRSQYGGVTGFTPQMVPNFQQIQQDYQQAASIRGQSLPAAGRPYPPPTGPYTPGPPPSSSSRRHKHSQHPPPAPSQHYEQRSSHGSKSKKHHKRRSVSPIGAAEQALYSDHGEEHREQAEEKQVRSRTQSPAPLNHPTQEGTSDHEHQTVESTNDDVIQGGVARSEEAQANVENVKQKSSSKKKKHHRRDHHDNYNAAQLPEGTTLDNNPNNLFQQPYQPQQYSQQPTHFGEYHNELPPQLKVHRQPLYAGYTQAYEESIRRGDISRKQAKRSTRLPPEVKQQLFPHEDDHKNQAPPPVQQHQQQQSYPFGPTPGYPQQPFGGVRPPFNPYPSYGPPAIQPNYYGSNPGSGPYTALQPWSSQGAASGSNEREVQHLLHRIRSLEGELQKLQRKLHKAKLNKKEAGGEKDEESRSHRRSKRDTTGSPRQTPVIVELNNATGEAIRDTPSKKHRNRTSSNHSSHHEQQNVEQDSTGIMHSTENIIGQDQRTNDTREVSQLHTNRTTTETEIKSLPAKPTREETAAQLAHAAVAHLNNRQGFVGGSAQQHVSGPPPPPPAPQIGRSQLPNQQQQYIYQPGVLPPQGQQNLGPRPRLPPGTGNVVYQGDPYQQQQQIINPNQRNMANQNYNQSNNNELFGNDDNDDADADDDDDEEEEEEEDDDDDDDDDDVDNDERRQQLEQSRSAEKILDAFERFYVTRGKSSATPMKVKYIPEDNNSNQPRLNHQQLNTNNNNNNRYCSSSRQSHSSSSSSSESIYSNSPSISRHSIYDNTHRKSTTNPFI